MEEIKGRADLLGRADFFKKVGTTIAGTVAATALLPKTAKAKGHMKGKMGMVIDLDRCVGCKACAIACKTEFETRLGVFKSQVHYRVSGTFPNTKRDMLPWMCNHCSEPTCIKPCPVKEIDAEFKGTKFKKKATYKRPDGIVLVDQDRCIGCGECIANCPYKVRFFDPGKKAGGDAKEHPADKCNLCEHRVDNGVVPACVNTCLARARTVGDLMDSGSEASQILKKKKGQALLAGKGTKPNVLYVGASASRIDQTLASSEYGDDLRKDANSKYQLKVT